MKIGVVARPETSRGLGIQTREVVNHLPVERVLQVNFPIPTGARQDYDHPRVQHATYDVTKHRLDLGLIEDFLRGLDVVFCAETPYDWRLLEVARELGVKTVVQGNPEFVRHGQPDFDLPHPDEWWWPSRWRLNKVPSGQVVPVPMPTIAPARAPAVSPLSVLHVSGHRAHEERNGTDLFLRALSYTTKPMHITVTSVDENPITMVRPRRNITFRALPAGFTNRWDAYLGHHLVVIPRRYGGLCLPALEAAACGVAVAMPDSSPNADFATILMPYSSTRHVKLACGPVEVPEVEPQVIAEMLDSYADDREALCVAGDQARERTLMWDDGGTELYLNLLEEVVAR